MVSATTILVRSLFSFVFLLVWDDVGIPSDGVFFFFDMTEFNGRGASMWAIFGYLLANVVSIPSFLDQGNISGGLLFSLRCQSLWRLV